MALTFPASPTNGQIYDQYVYNATSQTWRVYGSDTGITNVLATKANLSGGNTFTGNQVFSSGYIQQNSQPSFSTSMTGGWITVSPNNVVVFNSPQFNIGSNFNSSNGRFTAPVAGRYVFAFNFYIDGQRQASFRKNGSDYIPSDTAIAMTPTGTSTTSASYLFNLNAGDYVEIGCRSGSTSLYFYSGHSWFMGYMVG